MLSGWNVFEISDIQDLQLSHSNPIVGLNPIATLAAPLPSGWSISIQMSGITPFNLNFGERSNPNMTVEYNGPVVISAATPDGFDIISRVDRKQNGLFSSQSTNNLGDQSGQADFVSALFRFRLVLCPNPPPCNSQVLAWWGWRLAASVQTMIACANCPTTVSWLR
jgi:hypothetical protein